MEEKGVPSLIMFGFVTLFSTLAILALMLVVFVLFGS